MSAEQSAVRKHLQAHRQFMKVGVVGAGIELWEAEEGVRS